MRVLDLFSGIGGFSLGLERAGMTTVAFCEQDAFCQKVLAKHWPDIPIHDDVRTLEPDHVGPIDLVCGGFPCQPFSLAGKRKGDQDDRDLWPEMYRLVKGIRPRWVCGENVTGLISMGLDRVLSDLESIGYAVQPFVIPACAVDARHRRDRVWIVANARSEQHQNGCVEERRPPSEKLSRPQQNGGPCGPSDSRRWPPESGVCRVAHGVPKRVDRLRSLGNAVVPQVVERIGRAVIAATSDDC